MSVVPAATAGQFNLTLEIARNLPIPVPPEAEQHRIISAVLASVTDMQERLVEAAIMP
jgi:hypothetical protein